MGCDGSVATVFRSDPISIHAPTWGATSVDLVVDRMSVISIHAPTWGATHLNHIQFYAYQKFQSTHPHGVRHTRFIKCLSRLHFNPRTHMGCDSDFFSRARPPENFNPRTHMGCDPTPAAILPPISPISIHAPTWGATSLPQAFARSLSFQSTHPHGVRLKVTINVIWRLTFNPRTHMGCDMPHRLPERAGTYFNPRTHMGCDVGWSVKCTLIIISIHAPTWGATFVGVRATTPPIISIHAPTWGATADAPASIALRAHFNPRTHMGCDSLPSTGGRNLSRISIHAPTWGATIQLAFRNTRGGVFQSTHPHGVRLVYAYAFCPSAEFQSTHPHEVRPILSCLWVYRQKFQSTHPHGVRRPSMVTFVGGSGISIHAPTWGATQPTLIVLVSAPYFNPRTHMGCDRKIIFFFLVF